MDIKSPLVSQSCFSQRHSLFCETKLHAQSSGLEAEIASASVEPKLTEWRHDIVSIQS